MGETIGVRSAGEAAGIEKCLLLGGRDAAQCRVAVGKAAEAPDGLRMQLSVAREFIVAMSAGELEAAFLVGECLRVHERQIQKLALGLRQLPIEAARERPLGDGAGE